MNVQQFQKEIDALRRCAEQMVRNSEEIKILLAAAESTSLRSAKDPVLETMRLKYVTLCEINFDLLIESCARRARCDVMKKEAE